MRKSNNYIQQNNNNGFAKFVGSSVVMKKVYSLIEKAATCDIPVLLSGETGTGKEIAANTIHRLSDRHSSMFLPVNLGAIPETLVSSILFGHEKGAFTGADRLHRGVFEEGKDGTVLLDEIGTIDYKAQIALLRLLEEKKFSRLGGRDVLSSDARIIAASNENLLEKTKTGAFREDLFYRLDVFDIKLPPLRERPEDIPELAESFIRKLNQPMQKKIQSIDDDALRILKEYEWPGNVRELKNTIQSAMIVCEGAKLVPENLPKRFFHSKTRGNRVTFSVGTSLEKVEREMIIRALEYTRNNRTRAADLLGITRRAIYNKLKKHRILEYQ